ncbi:MAG: hypothetical protein MZV70_56410 [Desulfobacterales bacterium]|nr:hypothetical protein [Desulfobacterales bacterium]
MNGSSVSKGESLNLSNLKTPGPTLPQSAEEMEPFLLDKTQQFYKIIDFIEKLYKFFIRARVSKSWSSKTTPALKKWVRIVE